MTTNSLISKIYKCANCKFSFLSECQRKVSYIALKCVVTPYTEELPYFQCFFVDEDEAQFPFYAFSPLQIWSFSLTSVWGLQCNQFIDNYKVTSPPVLLKHSWCTSLLVFREKKTSTAEDDGWNYVIFLSWLSSHTKYMQLESFLFFLFILFVVFCSFEKDIKKILHGTMYFINFCGSYI